MMTMKMKMKTAVSVVVEDEILDKFYNIKERCKEEGKNFEDDPSWLDEFNLDTVGLDNETKLKLFDLIWNENY